MVDCSSDKSAVEYVGDFIEDHNDMFLVENTENIGSVKTRNKRIKLANYINFMTNVAEVWSNLVHRNLEIMDADSYIGMLSCIILDKDGNN